MYDVLYNSILFCKRLFCILWGVPSSRNAMTPSMWCPIIPKIEAFTFQKALVSAIYKILDISDKHILAQLHTVLNQGVREVFNGLYTDYSNFYKYTGKVWNK